MTSTTLHLVRHAESRWNVELRYQGQQDSGLTERGVEQAAALAGWLAEQLGPVTRVVASDLTRARETAAPFAARVGAAVHLDRRLRELDVGTWSGRLFTELADSEPEVVRALAAGDDVSRGGGETFAEARTRVSAAMADLVPQGLSTDAPRGATVAFTHGGPIRVAAAEALELPSPGHQRIGPPANCSVSNFERIDGRWRLLGYNRLTVVDAIQGPTE